MNTKNLGPTRYIIQSVILALVVLIFLVCVIFDSFLQTESLHNEKNIPLDSGWTIRVDGKTLAQNQTLPYLIKGELVGKTCEASLTLPLEFPNHNTCLALETGMTSLEVLVEGESLYRFDATGSPWKRPVYGGGYSHFIRLPDWTRGKQLVLRMVFSSNNSFAGHIAAPELGSKASVLLDQLVEWPSLVFGYSFCLLGVICVVVALTFRKGKERDNLFYFGWLEIALGAWVFTQSCSKLFFIRNPAVPMNFSLAALYLLPFFLSKFVCVSYQVRSIEKKLCNLSIIFPIAYVFVGILQLLGVMQYTDLLIYAGGALVLFLLAFFIASCIDYFKGNKALGSFLLAIFILLASVISEELLLFLGIILRNAVILHIGMSLSGIILFWHSAQIIKEGNLNKFKEKMLLDMAFTDSLTGLKNRSAYEKRVQDIIDTKKDHEVIGVLLMDVNNLKKINDSFGHSEGDRVLKHFSKEIENLVPRQSEIYRIGGDEFVCLIPRTAEEDLQRLAKEIETRKFSDTYSVAVGYSIFIPRKREKFNSIIHKADSSMYTCKNRMKQTDNSIYNTL